MAATTLRISFALGVAGVLLSIGVGAVSAVVHSGRPPPLARHPLEPAQDALAAGDRERFVDDHRMFAAIQARDAKAHLKLANVLLRSGADGEAIGVLEEVLELHPVPPQAHAMLAALYARQGRLHEARAQAHLARQHGAKLPPALLRVLDPAPPPR